MIPHLGRKMRRQYESPVVCTVRQTSRSPAASQCTCKDPSEPGWRVQVVRVEAVATSWELGHLSPQSELGTEKLISFTVALSCLP